MVPNAAGAFLAGGGLPVTGFTGAILAAVGLACLAGGALLLVAGRRRVIP